MKTSSKTEPDSTPSPLFSPADPKRKDMPSQSKGMTQDNQHSTTKPKMTSLDARSQTLTSSHLNSKETAGRASPQSTLTTKPLSQQSVANVTLRSVKLKRKRKPKTTPLNTAKDLTSAKPITTPSVMQTSPTVSTTVMKPDSTALPTGKQPDITLRIILGIFAVALVGLVIWLQSYLRSRQLHGKNFVICVFILKGKTELFGIICLYVLIKKQLQTLSQIRGCLHYFSSKASFLVFLHRGYFFLPTWDDHSPYSLIVSAILPLLDVANCWSLIESWDMSQQSFQHLSSGVIQIRFLWCLQDHMEKHCFVLLFEIACILEKVRIYHKMMTK